MNGGKSSYIIYIFVMEGIVLSFIKNYEKNYIMKKYQSGMRIISNLN